MQILLLRHAIAEDRLEFAETGQPDEARPLTERGQKRMFKGARALRRLVPHVDVLVSSPLVRAVETANILAEVYAARDVSPSRLVYDGLIPGTSLDGVVEWLHGRPVDSVNVLVGHQPELSWLAARLLTGREEPWLRFKKGAACLLELRDLKSNTTMDDGFELVWAMAPAQLRILGAGGID